MQFVILDATPDSFNGEGVVSRHSLLQRGQLWKALLMLGHVQNPCEPLFLTGTLNG